MNRAAVVEKRLIDTPPRVTGRDPRITNIVRWSFVGQIVSQV